MVSRQKIYFLALAFLGFALISVILTTKLRNLTALDGTIDLQGIRTDTVYRTNGQWLFFPNKVLAPHEFLKDKAYWLEQAKSIAIGTGFQDGAQPLMDKSQGIATYLLRLEHVPDEVLALWGTAVFTSARLFVFAENGQGADRPIEEIGRFSGEADQNLPQISRNTVPSFQSVPGMTHYVLIQVGNFHHSWGGIWIPPFLSSQGSGVKALLLNQQMNFWLIGMTSFVAIYALSLYLRRREDSGSLWLFLTALSWSFRNFWYTNNAADWLHNLKWSYELNYKFQWMFWLPNMVLVFAFFRSCFRAQTRRWFLNAVVLLSLPLVLFAMVTPVAFHYPFMKVAYSAGYPIVCILALVILYRALRDRAEGANWLLYGTIAVSLSIMVDVLYTYDIVLFNFNNFTGIGMVAFLVCQSQIIAERFAKAFRQSEYLSRELKEEVDRQTRDIKSILNTIKQGIFSIKAVDSPIDPQYSQYLSEIVGSRDLAHNSIRSLLLDRGDLDPDQKAQVLSSLEASLGEDIMNFEVNQQILFSELRYHSWDGKTKILEVDWIPMLDGQNHIERILIDLRDVTEIRQLQLRTQQQEADLKILIELISIPEDRFHRFLNKTKDYLRQNQELVQQTVDGRPDIIRQLFVNMHTIKGTARTYLLRAIAAASHEVEDHYHKLSKGLEEWNRDRLLDDLHRLEHLVEHYRTVGQEKLGWQLSDRFIKMSISTVESVLFRLNEVAKGYLDLNQRSEINSARITLYNATFVRIQDVIDEACRGLDSIARDLEKKIPALELDLPLVVMRDQGVNLLHGLLVHLLRNSMDHGIELPKVRKEKGKSEQGKIYVRAHLCGGVMAMEFGDDGAGLDLDAILAKAISKGLVAASQPKNPESIAALIFEAGLSTKSSISEISGRGVGLNAVKSYLEESGGSVRIVLADMRDRQHVAFHFELKFPDHLFIPMDLDGHSDLGVRPQVVV